MIITRLLPLILSLVFVSCSSGQETKETTTFKPTKKTLFQTKTLLNKDFNITNISNKVVLQDNNKDFLFLIFFTTTCKACTAEITALNHLNAKYKNIKFISFVLDSDDIDVLSFFKTKYNIQYPIAHTLLENEDLFSSITNQKTVPFMILYDKQGNYKTHYSSAVVEEMIDIDFTNLSK